MSIEIVVLCLEEGKDDETSGCNEDTREEEEQPAAKWRVTLVAAMTLDTL